MRRKKRIYLIAVTWLLVVMLSGCGAKKESTSYDRGSDENYTAQVQVEESAPDYEVAADTAAVAEKPLASTSTTTSNQALLNTQEKIIRRAALEVETQDFDNLIQLIDTQINQLGGYVESSNISGRYYYSDNMRYGNIVARVPKDKLDQFIGNVYDIANVVNKQESTENVTLQYVDTESHKKALEIEQERLLALLEKVESLEDILVLETRLSSVRYELQGYESQLRIYDNLVEYSTVSLNIQEVERMTATEEKEQSVWSRIRTGFGDTMYNIGEGFKNFIIWFAVNLPYLILWAIVITIIVLIGRRYYKKSKANSLAQQQEPMLGLKKNDNKEK